MRAFIVIALIIFSANSAFAQGTLIGKIVYEENGVEKPLFGANIWWKDSETGATTLEDGTFEIPYVRESNILIVSFVGFKRLEQPIEGRPERIPKIVMEEGDLLEQVTVREVIRATELSTRSVGLTYEINKKELRKAACCNVAESFETNPAVDVSFSDAVTGAKRIEMLGLAGKYAPLQIENVPFGRGLAVVSGMSYIPGPWVENIHLSKGVGTVVNGFESTTGLIDVELTGPALSERTHINAYLNTGGRNEINLVNVKKHNDVWSSAHLLHASSVPLVWDVNDNGFIDMPLGSQLNGISRWKYSTGSWEGQFGVHYLFNRNRGGQTDYDFSLSPEENRGQVNGDTSALTSQRWGMEILSQRLSVFSKTAYLFSGKRQSSLGLILNAATHDQSSFFGTTSFEAKQDYMYANLIYQSGVAGSDCGTEAGNSWIYTTGVSLQYDNVRNDLSMLTSNIASVNQFGRLYREESVAGVFGEAQWKPSLNFDAVFGLRADHSNLFGSFVTPRLHLRYAVQENTILRAHAGMGRRSPLPVQENLNLLASSRSMVSSVNALDLSDFQFEQEVAWNFGVSLQQEFRWFYRKGTIVFDAYYTHFLNQLVVDVDASTNQTALYFGEGGFSRGVMAQVDYEFLRRWQGRVAYKYLDVQQPFASGLRETQLLSPHRAFVNIEYETRNEWAFDLTVNWYASQRLPDHPQLDARSPAFFILNGQIRKDVNNKLSLFLGLENILDFRQDRPIFGAGAPFSSDFDATMVWGPIFGRMAYLRMDYTF
ncbi:MAG: TonB-dependent receptor [Flavobacteriales bacterium]|nr:MAG: TonB-dependent receptor [Flavobacteriales bacterium]